MNKFNHILKSELIESMGCTEPAAIALAVAYAKEQLPNNSKINKVVLKLSSNVLKNALCVTIPNTSEYGINMIVALAIEVCESKNKLTLLKNITKENIENAAKLLNEFDIDIKLQSDCDPLYICVEIFSENHNAQVVIEKEHDNITSCKKDGNILLLKNVKENHAKTTEKFSFQDLLEFVNGKEIDFEILKEVKKHNCLIAEEGLEKSLGMGVGNAINNISLFNEKIKNVVAKTVAGIDARMSGLAKKVYINSGSGNQGITATVPVIEMSKILGVSEEQELRALALSHLTAIYIRNAQGKLSSACGAVCASAGVAAAVAYLNNASGKQIQGAVLNLLCSNFGVFCDGAKSTCALKVASAISAALIAGLLAKNNVFIDSNLGVISNSLEETLKAVSVIENKLTQSMDQAILDVVCENVKYKK